MPEKVKAVRLSRRPVMGWREWIALPELGISRIKAKVDTGARSSSLHAYDIRVIRRRSGDIVRFKVHPIQRSSRGVVETEARILDERSIRSSSGHASRRFVIETEIEIGGERWPIEMSLTNRDEMGFRMLLGRQAIRRRFVVDPGLSYLVGQVPAKRKKRSTRLHRKKGRTP